MSGATMPRGTDIFCRHEETHVPQHVWLCAYDSCRSLSDKDRKYSRRDHLKTHMKKKHPDHEPTDERLLSCRQPANSEFDERCIFQDCQTRFQTWSERIDHMAEHFHRPWTEAEWRRSEDMETGRDQSGVPTYDSEPQNMDSTPRETSTGTVGALVYIDPRLSMSAPVVSGPTSISCLYATRVRPKGCFCLHCASLGQFCFRVSPTESTCGPCRRSRSQCLYLRCVRQGSGRCENCVTRGIPCDPMTFCIACTNPAAHASTLIGLTVNIT